MAIAVGWYGWSRLHPAAPEAARTAAPSAVPVTAANVQKQPFPITLTGLGTVQSVNTVTVRTRVDGQIETIAFTQGQMVQSGDLLVQIDSRPYRAALDQAVAKKKQDEALLANSQRDLERYRKLGQYGTAQQLDTQTATVAQQQALLAADQAAIDTAQTQLNYATIRAPITGLAGFRLVDAGNIVNASTQTGIVTLTQLEPINAVYSAPEASLPDIVKALAAGPVEVSVYSADGARRLSVGRLDIVNNQVDTATGTIRLKAVFDNKDHALWPGASITTRMWIKTLPDAVTIPDDAVQHGPNGLFVYVVDDQNQARVKPVKVTLSNEGMSVIGEGLEPGQKVVAEGQYRIQDGTKVAPRDQTFARRSPAGAQ